MQNEEQSLNSDAEIIAEFERLVLEGGHSREKAERLVSNLYGRTALGDRGRTRAAIHELVIKSEVCRRPRKTVKAEAETKADIQAEETEAEAEAKAITELASEAFAAQGIWEPKETNEVEYNLLLEALKNAYNAGSPLDIDLASEIVKAILAGVSAPNLPAGKAEETKIVTFEAPASSLTEAETRPVPTLIELEARVTETWNAVRTNSWEWACALTAIHDSKLFPDSASAGSWERYTEGRWGLRRTQSYRLVAWVKHEISLVPALEEPETPETPVPPGGY